MRSFHALRGALMAGALLLGATWLPAATFEVNQTSGPFTDVQSALDAATTGSTVIITDSATYTTATLRWEKRLTLMAEAGQNPTLIDDRNTSDGGAFFSIASADAAAVSGSQLGSNDGGRINLLFDTTATSHHGPVRGEEPNSPRNYLVPRLTGAWEDLTSFTIENIYLTQLKDELDDNSFRIHLWRDDGITTRMVHIDNVEVDAGAYPGGGDALLRLNNPYVYCTVNDSYLHNFDGNWPLYIRRGATLELTNTAVDARDSGSQLLVSFTDDIRFNTFNVTNSLLVGGEGGIIWRRSAGANWNFQNSAFIAPRGNSVFRTTGVETDTIVADHCDFIVINNDFGDYPVIDYSSGASTKNISIRNSNVVLYADPTDGTSEVLNIASGINDEIVLEYNNVYGTWDGDNYSSNLSPDNSISEDPVYFNAQVGDVRYHNTIVKTSDESGDPIGNDDAFTELVPVELSTFDVM